MPLLLDGYGAISLSRRFRAQRARRGVLSNHVTRLRTSTRKQPPLPRKSAWVKYSRTAHVLHLPVASPEQAETRRFTLARTVIAHGPDTHRPFHPCLHTGNPLFARFRPAAHGIRAWRFPDQPAARRAA